LPEAGLGQGIPAKFQYHAKLSAGAAPTTLVTCAPRDPWLTSVILGVAPPIGLVSAASDPTPDETSSDPADPVIPSGQVAISETLEELAREGARRMLERALHSEVDACLGRRRYDRVDDDFIGYRNGFAREREISIGTWAVEVRPPSVAGTPGHIPPFRSSILPVVVI
jgi:hypothetical protein